MSRGYSRNGQEDATVRKEALDMAAKADIVLYFFGLNEDSESEGMDRTHMRIPQNQINLLQELGQVNPNLVGIIVQGLQLRCHGIIISKLFYTATSTDRLVQVQLWIFLREMLTLQENFLRRFPEDLRILRLTAIIQVRREHPSIERVFMLDIDIMTLLMCLFFIHLDLVCPIQHSNTVVLK